MPYGRVVSFKVGHTDRPLKERLRAYKTHNPYAECIFSKEDGTLADEQRYHDYMSNYDLFFQRDKTEWYEVIDRTLINGIERYGFNYLDAIFAPNEEENGEENNE